MSQWSHLYNNRAWRVLRARQLSTEPLCAYCLRLGHTKPASVCDHIDPHQGDVAKFWAGPFQSLCKACHDGAKASLEATGKLRGCSTDGEPDDPAHPWRQG
jgi:5-methylcytosine-specific restriction protein A